MNEQTNHVDPIDLPDDSVTVIIKAKGKLYTQGALIGDINPDMADEDLDSTLRALNGLGISTQRTVAVQLGGRDETYKLPGNDTEQDLTPLAEEIAKVDLEKASDEQSEEQPEA